ncbi:glutamate-5-semialdehyde dehydrogenase [Chlamydiota bacterium]
MTDIKEYIIKMSREAKVAAREMALVTTAEKNDCLLQMAEEIDRKRDWIKSENAKDIVAAEKSGLQTSLMDRLTLTDKRIYAMSEGLREVVELRDPVGAVIEEKKRPNNLIIQKVRVPLGVVAIIYESRPNVTVDAAGLCLKSGNAVILRGGKEALHSNVALAHVLQNTLKKCSLPDDAVKMVEVTDRDAVLVLLKQDDYIDVVIPRGGESLIRKVTEESLIPVIKHYKGVCHVYVDEECNFAMAKDIIINAKTQRPGVCNAIETLLVHEKIAQDFLPDMVNELQAKKVEIRGDEKVCSLFPEVKKAIKDDWSEEYLDLILAVKIVRDCKGAISHISTYGSHHSDAIITTNKTTADLFLNSVDSSAVYHNASTRFTDGYEFGLGAEIGISTDKLHARGPMGLEELTSYKYKVYGTGQIRS